MKKFLLSLIALLGVVSANAQELSIADVQIVPGTQATFAIVMNNETEMLFRDSEFHFSFPAGISPVGAAKGDQDLIPGDNLIDGDYRVAISDNSGKGIGGTFTVCYVTIEAEAGLAEGTYQATLTKAEMTAKPSAEVYDVIKKNYENITFNIVVTNVLTLDENSTSAPGTAENVNVHVKRTVKAGEWGTICLPFDMYADQVEEVFGAGTEFAKFVGYTKDGGAPSNNAAYTAQSIKLNFASHDWSVEGEDGIFANTPYLVKSKKDVSEFDLEAVEMIDPQEVDAEYNNGKTGSRKVVWGHFYGTQYAGQVIPENGLFLSGGNFYYSKGKTKIKGFRGYFVLNDVLADLASSGVKMEFDVTTNIDGVRLTDSEGAVYTVDGKFIGRDVDLKKLQKGIYVVDGKKVAIK